MTKQEEQEAEANIVYWVKILVKSKRYEGELLEPIMSWGNMSSRIRLKWDWYFKYRAALFQVKYPRAFIEVSWGIDKPSGNMVLEMFNRRARAKKSKITAIENNLRLARENWTELFPIEEDLLYKKCLEKLERKKRELQEHLNSQPTTIY